MSASDLGTIVDALSRLSSYMPSLDPGFVLTAIGVAIIGFFVLYVTGVVIARMLSWIASMTPEQFTRFILVLGIVFLVAGLVVP